MAKKLTKTNPDYDKIIEKCKDLYITPNIRGNWMHNEKIVRKLQEVFDITMTVTMIRFWADKFGWDKLREKSRMVQLAKVRSEHMSQEEKLANTLQQHVARMYSDADELTAISINIINEAYETGTLSPTNAIKLLKDCVDTKMKLLGIEDNLNIKLSDTRLEELKKMTPEDREALKQKYLEQLKNGG